MMNIIFRENLNEMIHHAQQKISNTFCRAPAPHRTEPSGSSTAAPLRRPAVTLARRSGGKPAARDKEKHFVFISKRAQRSSKADRLACEGAAAFPGAAARRPPRAGSAERRDDPFRFLQRVRVPAFLTPRNRAPSETGRRSCRMRRGRVTERLFPEVKYRRRLNGSRRWVPPGRKLSETTLPPSMAKSASGYLLHFAIRQNAGRAQEEVEKRERAQRHAGQGHQQRCELLQSRHQRITHSSEF